MLLGWALVIASMVMMCVLQREYGNLWPLAFVAVVPAIVAQYRFMPRKLSGLPWDLFVRLLVSLPDAFGTDCSVPPRR